MGDEWFYARNGERHGPVPLAKVKALADKGWLLPDDLVWRPGMTEWRPASSVRGLMRGSLVESLGSAADGVIPGIRPGREPDAVARPPADARPTPIFGPDAFAGLGARHVAAACGAFVAALGIAFTAIAPSALALVLTLGGLVLAAGGMHVEVRRHVSQALANMATARKEAAERRLELQRLAVEQKKLEVEAARLAAEKEERERPVPPPVPAAVPIGSQPGPTVPHAGAGQPRLVPAEHYGPGEQVMVINHPPVQRWSPGLAAVLSFLLPGLGQVYKGQIINGIAWFFLVGFGYLALVLPGLLLHFFCIVGAASGNPWTQGRMEVVRR
jgi:hypothetical protein